MRFDVPSDIINKLFENGYENQILDIVMLFEDDNNREVSDIPLSPTIMKDNGKNIIISEEVYHIYKKIVDRISNSNTAQEIPYFLLGNKKVVDGNECIYIEKIEFCSQEKLNDLKVSLDIDRFRSIILESSYDVVSIGHTHGNVDEDKKNNSLARCLPEEIKQKYDIRDIGLNISISDIWQHEAFKQIAKQYESDKEIMQTVIMYNGDIVVLDEISKSYNIQAVCKNELIQLATGNLEKNQVSKRGK